MQHPEPRRFQAGDRSLIVRLTMANILTATRRNRKALAEFGIHNIVGPGSELLMTSIVGQGPMPAMEADAVFATAALVENEPAIGVDEYLDLVQEFPNLAKVVEEEAADFIQPRRDRLVGYLAVWEQTMVKSLALVVGLDPNKVRNLIQVATGGAGSEPSPSSITDSANASSGDQPSAT